MQPIRETDLTALDKCTARYSSPASWEAVDWLLLKEQQQQTIALQNLSHIPGEVNILDPAQQKLFAKAGISEADLKDKQVSRFYTTVEHQGGLEAVQKDSQ
ncbi:hypothetical protein SKAU_G00105980 [Synaphobranchus kaupii]|uniref:Uncharacterized protein n=1 Tax=Synaphobranchus kaupii TaxID=118154 RepID=A0A9Q1G0C5_SYNKA|nr:hypothetical protein SKAU_G00105980 [Synaphobranchus kaupii]